MDTTKDYYEDSEAPEFQVQITNDVEKKVPWAEVPELNRYILKYDRPRGPKPKVRVPIVRVETISRDEQNRPAPLNKAYRFDVTEIGLNPKHRMHSSGGSAH